MSDWEYIYPHKGIVYLIHFNDVIGNRDNPRAMAKHYLGFANDLGARLQRHIEGRGSPLMKAVIESGIAWTVVRTWEGDRALERKLKNRKNSKHLCPICRELEKKVTF